jgi:hypothetical protein
MKKWTNELNRAFSKEEAQMAKKTHEEMLNISGHKGNVNQNHSKSLPHSYLEWLTSRTQTTTNAGKDA